MRFLHTLRLLLCLETLAVGFSALLAVPVVGFPIERAEVVLMTRFRLKLFTLLHWLLGTPDGWKGDAVLVDEDEVVHAGRLIYHQ